MARTSHGPTGHALNTCAVKPLDDQAKYIHIIMRNFFNEKLFKKYILNLYRLLYNTIEYYL